MVYMIRMIGELVNRSDLRKAKHYFHRGRRESSKDHLKTDEKKCKCVADRRERGTIYICI